ncbi:MAG: LysR family transcriptional regulator, partial [Pseudomonadales bacterium]|nr:LysR family transcriptional regulator [Pseudomonadales bacterium]
MGKLDEYQAFVSIVELKSLSKAAQALHLSPSAISKKLTQLEDSLSATLLERSTRSLAVTDVGKSFYRDCKTILSSVAEAEERLADNQKRTMGKLTLSCPR